MKKIVFDFFPTVPLGDEEGEISVDASAKKLPIKQEKKGWFLVLLNNELMLRNFDFPAETTRSPRLKHSQILGKRVLKGSEEDAESAGGNGNGGMGHSIGMCKQAHIQVISLKK